ncbi:WxL domain-containing protein [Enterococcus faecalis]|uniref:WxL domain-containing protein n=1 Tax=Enterococcus faecalis TaxID=1351 RepID=UPI000CF2EBDE|nr:WxL domain-containing protein [Enterococcus faecalis]EGO8529102.1 WxL domain-containing protein [Enterococcus faecalis]EKZ0150037.1 WxL domain-containing protein [Enterococcus faecalis]EME3239861.1 WxL domain-containing protein [Enterococcus faecalis]NSU93377.1 WxL domain-containing protein [Enterococcus faecalis]NVJ44761.1 WxL domain surface cell wall-binding protein [Enterococcus faecalis]
MPQINWRKWLVVGLSCSLFVDSVGSITALAETITSESPPTVASSTQETTTKTSTTSNPATTDTSQEEVEKQVETEVKESQKEEPPAEVKQEETPATSSENDPQKSISPRWVPNNQVIYPRMTFAFTDETGKAFADENLTLSGTYYKLARHAATSQWRPYADRYPIVSSNAGGGQYRVAVNAAVPMPYDFFTNLPVGYNLNVYAIEQLKIDNTLKYVDNIAVSTGTIRATSYINQQVSETPQFGNQGNWFVGERGNKFSENSTNIFSLSSVTNTTNHEELLHLLQVTSASNGTNPIVILVGFDGTPTYQQTVNYVVTRKQVTEKFVDANGVAITPPTGFTQNKKTPMTSNAFTFKQAGTLPDTYTTGGKTYKFKGWYKGKTKPNTLITTKTPSYGVTYDGNDDLTVMYEEATEFPEETYQFGFVNQDGDLVKPDDIVISYDYASFFFKDNSETWNTIAANQKATTSGNLKNVVKPSSSVPNPTANATGNGDHFINFSISLPKYYTELDVYDKSGKISSKYPLPPRHYYRNNEEVTNFMSDANLISRMTLSKSASGTYVTKDAIQYPEDLKTTGLTIMRRYVGFSETEGAVAYYHSLDAPFYYHLTQRKVTENFEDTNGAKITPPSGFTQGKQTVITSDDYTFKQAGTLPDSYTTGGKEYKFKGWYKGKTKTEPLTTTKAPSYPVTYDDNDDLHVVYEEVTTTILPGATYQFGFVDDSGKRIDPSKIKLTYDLWSLVNKESTILTKGNTGTNVANYKTLTLEDKEIAIPNVESGNSVYSPINVTFQLPKNYSAMVPSTGEDSRYPVPTITYHRSDQGEGLLNTAKTAFDVTKVANQAQSYTLSNTNTEASAPGVPYPRLYRRYAVPQQPMYYTNYNTFSGPVYYVLTQRKVTEHFIDESGAKITPPTGFTQGHQIPIDSETFTYTSAKALPDTYTVGDKTYLLKGWYKGKTRPTPLDQRKTPSFTPTFDDNDDMTAVYHEAKKAATLSLKPIVNIIPNDSSLLWTATLKNTGEAPLTKIKLAPTANWDTGLSAPTQLAVQIAGQPYQLISVTPEQWQSGVDLGIELPVGAQASIAITSPKVTGQPDQVLSAEVTATGDFPAVTAQNAVRIQGTDQVITDPEETGFISVPTFDFGQVGVAGTKQQHSLKKAADYYGNGTRNPYLRMKQTQPNWRLTAQLSQPKSATDSLPTATRLLLGTAAATSFTDYNQATETRIPLGKTSAVTLTADNTATAVVANQQFTGSDVYQLDFTFNNIKLEVPANQGLKGQQYQAAVTWNLVTGP